MDLVKKKPRSFSKAIGNFKTNTERMGFDLNVSIRFALILRELLE